MPAESATTPAGSFRHKPRGLAPLSGASIDSFQTVRLSVNDRLIFAPSPQTVRARGQGA
jgi:hypothetical protein